MCSSSVAERANCLSVAPVQAAEACAMWQQHALFTWQDCSALLLCHPLSLSGLQVCPGLLRSCLNYRTFWFCISQTAGEAGPAVHEVAGGPGGIHQGGSHYYTAEDCTGELPQGTECHFPLISCQGTPFVCAYVGRWLMGPPPPFVATLGVDMCGCMLPPPCTSCLHPQVIPHPQTSCPRPTHPPALCHSRPHPHPTRSLALSGPRSTWCRPSWRW